MTTQCACMLSEENWCIHSLYTETSNYARQCQKHSEGWASSQTTQSIVDHCAVYNLLQPDSKYSTAVYQEAEVNRDQDTGVMWTFNP